MYLMKLRKRRKRRKRGVHVERREPVDFSATAMVKEVGAFRSVGPRVSVGTRVCSSIARKWEMWQAVWI